MRILIAEDDVVSRRVLQAMLVKDGQEVVVTCDGQEAWDVLRDQAQAPKLAVLDWMMPGLDGVTVCKNVRALPTDQPPYLILLTAKGSKEDVVAGLESGADDYITKPFHPAELRARVHVAQRMLELRRALAERIHELESALTKVKQLQGLLPICCYCKKVRDDQNYWTQVESYFAAHAEVRFSHGICPDCFEKLVKSEGFPKNA